MPPSLCCLYFFCSILLWQKRLLKRVYLGSCFERVDDHRREVSVSGAWGSSSLSTKSQEAYEKTKLAKSGCLHESQAANWQFERLGLSFCLPEMILEHMVRQPQLRPANLRIPCQPGKQPHQSQRHPHPWRQSQPIKEKKGKSHLLLF